MELRDAVRERRMVRSFRPDPLDPTAVATLFDDALRAPTAGNSKGVAWLLLEGPEQTATYWNGATTAPWRAAARRWPGLSAAPLVALALCSAPAYLSRYAEADKATAGLGTPRDPHGPSDDADADARGGAGGGDSGGEAAWTVPYWFGDAAFSTMSVLLGAVDRGLGACFLGNFRGERDVLDALGVPGEWRLFGAVLLGHPAAEDRPSASLLRPGPSRAARLHRGGWSTLT
jgi:nitroreductase